MKEAHSSVSRQKKACGSIRQSFVIAAKTFSVFLFGQLLHVFDRITFIKNFPAEQGFDGVFQCNDASGLAELILDQEQVTAVLDEQV